MGTIKTTLGAPLAFITLLAIFVPAESAFAMRCGSKLVKRGDSQAFVLRFCGEPATKMQRTIYRSVPNHVFSESAKYRRGNPGYFASVIIEEWTYNLGPNKFMRLVRFENGVVADVDELGYGFRD